MRAKVQEHPGTGGETLFQLPFVSMKNLELVEVPQLVPHRQMKEENWSVIKRERESPDHCTTNGRVKGSMFRRKRDLKTSFFLIPATSGTQSVSSSRPTVVPRRRTL